LCAGQETTQPGKLHPACMRRIRCIHAQLNGAPTPRVRGGSGQARLMGTGLAPALACGMLLCTCPRHASTGGASSLSGCRSGMQAQLALEAPGGGAIRGMGDGPGLHIKAVRQRGPKGRSCNVFPGPSAPRKWGPSGSLPLLLHGCRGWRRHCGAIGRLL
jgi:hypothetical protein